MKNIGDLKSKIRKFTCTEEEGEKSFLSDEELCCFIDMAQKKAMTKISCLNKDYLTTCADIDVEAGQESFTLPEDIKATKIKQIQWQGGSSKCCTKLKRGSYDCIGKDCAGTPCEYVFFNKKDVGVVLYLNPKPSKAGKLTVIYERKPCDIDGDTPDDQAFEFDEICDYVFNYVTMMIYEKEKNPLISSAASKLNEAEQDMLECLCPQFLDDCEVTPDEDGKCYLNGGTNYGSW